MSLVINFYVFSYRFLSMDKTKVISDNFNTIWTDENLMILLNPLSIGYISGQALMHSYTHALMQKEK